MHHSEDFPEIAKVLKRLLKERHITYRDLAKKLQISESSVKKQFIADDCSLHRLSQVCKILGVSVSDVLSAPSASLIKFRFTTDQETFLTKNALAFKIYWKLVYEGESLAKIREHFSLSESAFFQQLHQLDKQSLIELLPGGKVKVPDMSLVLWENNGPLVEKIKKEWSELLLKKALHPQKGDNVQFGLRFFMLKKETYLEFTKAVDDLQLEFGRRSVREKKLSQKEVIPVGMVSILATGSFV